MPTASWGSVRDPLGKASAGRPAAQPSASKAPRVRWGRLLALIVNLAIWAGIIAAIRWAMSA